MKLFHFILIILALSIDSYSQNKDTLLTHIRLTDDYSIFKNTPHPNSSKRVFIRDKVTQEDIEDKSKLPTYEEMIKKAEESFKKKNYEEAINLYHLAIKLNDDKGKVKDRYNLACCYSMLKMNDLAFVQLERIAFKGGYYNYIEITEEKKFKTLQNDSRWEYILEKIKQNAHNIQEKLNKELKKQ